MFIHRNKISNINYLVYGLLTNRLDGPIQSARSRSGRLNGIARNPGRGESKKKTLKITIDYLR